MPGSYGASCRFSSLHSKWVQYDENFIYVYILNLLIFSLNAFITCTRSADLPLDDLQWAFELTKANMKDVYERNEWKWNDREKRDEMQADNAR